jgi:drug/metabolite transporter (DMT)-like permease
VALGVVGTGASYVLNYQLIADEGPTAASTATYLIPVVAVILGAFVLAEPVSWNLALGATTILAGVAISEGRLPHLPGIPHTKPNRQPVDRRAASG